jgi:hypothetical protein
MPEETAGYSGRQVETWTQVMAGLRDLVDRAREEGRREGVRRGYALCKADAAAAVKRVFGTSSTVGGVRKEPVATTSRFLDVIDGLVCGECEGGVEDADGQ